ncbi:ABC transporter permease [Parapedobacter indicus]|uniref:ABC-type antimicrobial peptide transport system, permease component n=1 Tax=Parapedobacter indicus TaxID=1477437 RepID=A0A1I3HDA8_9SPHI|nr:ABC transporter permease [Parapedobacter indicus]PPL02988.1 ABC-type antimicrobial peptide transport system permease subunit [Parapedobacter indicus]SFI33619.1 ABC-type antimicrobial peptide transport system, permease component [Parapedobacter indicus]
MIKNYFKTAWRNLKEHKFHTFVNISGLAFGLATAILLLLWVQHERSYDRFHKDYSRIHRIIPHLDANTVWEGVPGPLAVYAQSVPEVEAIVRVMEGSGQVLATEDRSTVLDDFTVAYVDSTFLTLFDFGLLNGETKPLFPNPNSITLTESTAKKFFGEDDPMGKVLQLRGENFTVAGVLRDFPDNSSLAFDAVLPMAHYAQRFTANGGNGDWKTIDTDLGNYAFKTFVKLHSDANPETVGRKFTQLYKDARNGESTTVFKLQPLADQHLVSVDGNTSAARMVQVFLLIAILVLAIAAINYVNLTTARALVRAREVGIRKVVGASKVQLFLQFIAETALLFCFALLIAIGLIVLLLPLYNNISGKQLHFSLANPEMWKVVGYSAVGTLVAASIYPALLLSGFQPLQVMKGKMASGRSASLLRKVLVVFQFSIAMVLIVATLVISRQMAYMRKVDLGYDKSYVFSASLPDAAVEHIDAVKNELTNHPGIVSIALSNVNDITNMDNSTGDLDWPGKPENSGLIISQSLIDGNFIPTMGIELLEGRNLTGTAADSNLYVVNEAAVRAMGLTPPYVGTPISFHDRPGTIVGVVKDFNFKPLKEKISPLLFFNWWTGNRLYVRTTAAEAANAIKAVERQYKKYAGDIPAPFRYEFVDQQFEAKYRADQRAGLLFNIFAGIAIFISCLGLLGLSTYTVRQRVKEIGIRKVLGASVSSIVGLLSSGSLWLILISVVLGTPIAWWTMSNWLDDFAYRIEIQWWMFVVAGLAALLIALLTVSFQAIKAAVANPVESLRDE